MQKLLFKAFEASYYHFSMEIIKTCMYVGYILIQGRVSIFYVVNLLCWVILFYIYKFWGKIFLGRNF